MPVGRSVQPHHRPLQPPSCSQSDTGARHARAPISGFAAQLGSPGNYIDMAPHLHVWHSAAQGRTWGLQRANSPIQLGSTDSGTTTRCGPSTPRSNFR